MKPSDQQVTGSLNAQDMTTRSLFTALKQVSDLYSAYREYLIVTSETVESVPFKTYIEKHVTEYKIHEMFELSDMLYKNLKGVSNDNR